MCGDKYAVCNKSGKDKGEKKAYTFIAHKIKIVK